MRIDRLRLVGFKSFADAAELTIAPGLTGIVGPNGCGKSNLVDALRWAMGEASARRLRGGEMDDVIFAGAAGRPARNIAEAALSIDNSDRAAPPAFNDRDEIEVVRRIERGGGSAYRLNGREVRARDVQVLLADAGAGGHSRAIVSQGRVGALIDAKPAERRQLLEEAAGVSGLQLRRRETETRLRSAEDNLARLDDVIATLAAQLSGLEKQARRARRYRRLAEQIRQAEALLFYARWLAAVAEAERTQLDRDAAAHAGEEAAARAAEERARCDAADALVPPLRLAEARAESELQARSRARETLEQELQRLTVSRGEAERRRAELAADLEREEGRLADAAAALDRLAQEARTLSVAAAEEDPAGEDASARQRDAAESLAVAEAELQRATRAEAESAARRAALDRRRRELAESVGRLEGRHAGAERHRAALAAGMVTPTAVGTAAAALAEAEQRVERSCAAVAEAERRTADCRALEGASAEATREVVGSLAGLRPEAAAIEMALAAVPSEDGGEPVLAALRVAAGFEAAIGAAFDDELSAPAAMEYADEHTPAQFWAELPLLDVCAPLPPGAYPLADAVTAPAILGRSLAQAGWVDSAEAGHRLQPVLRPGQRLVDREGRLWRWDGFTRTARSSSIAVQHLRYKNRLSQLAAEIADAENRQRLREAQLAAARADRVQAAEAEGAARTGLREAEAALSRARSAHSALEQQKLAAETRLAGLADTLGQLAAELAEAQRQATEAETELAALPLAEPMQRALDTARVQAAEARRREAETRAAVERLARNAETRRQRLSAIAEEEQSWHRRADGAAAQYAAFGERRRAVEDEIAALLGRLAGIARESEAAGPAVAHAAAECRNAADALAQGEAARHRAAEASRLADTALGEVKLRYARLEALHDGTQDSLARLAREIGERLGVPPEALAELSGLAADAPGPDPADAAARLDRLQRERDAIGPVNLVAEREAAEIGARVEELRRERLELTEAIARLRRGMANLDRDARERLTAAFERVNRHFADLFMRLFGGGRARLALTDDADPLAAGLEILANPAGKRLQTLSLLSGGEQALTALALIFAVFLTNPAPVCVLDEVDAPLDDANVERLCGLVAEIAEETGTRFLVVTHHRITMARADRLFGVTMAEPGVSQLVSVDLARAVRRRVTSENQTNVINYYR